MNRTKIQYLTYSWSPIAMRCTPVSEGCAHCWHLRMANRLAGNKTFSPEIRAAYAGEGLPVLVESRLNGPLNVKPPAIIGVQWMGDLFHKEVSDRLRYKTFKIMAAAYWHVFVVLTKRADAMLDFCGSKWYQDLFHIYGLSNVWLMVSVENPAYCYRADYLRQSPAAVRAISFEPLLASFADYPGVLDDIDFAVVGCESGPGRRPMEWDWVRDIRDQCQAANVPFFLKQGVVDGKVVGLPELDGRQWKEMPKGVSVKVKEV